MTTLIHRCRPSCRTYSALGRSAASRQPTNKHPLRSFSQAAVHRAKDDDRASRQQAFSGNSSQQGEQYSDIPETNEPIIKGRYNPLFRPKTLPAGYEDDITQADEDIADLRSKPNRKAPVIEADEDDDGDDLLEDSELDDQDSPGERNSTRDPFRNAPLFDFDRYAEKISTDPSLSSEERDEKLTSFIEDTQQSDTYRERMAAQFGDPDEYEDPDEVKADDDDEDDRIDIREERVKSGFFALDEEKDDPGEDPEFNNDDITSLAHGELEQHRELRGFYRNIIWDMPLLYNHRKPYNPPTTATPLHFRYTTYLGEQHPSSKKVVVSFSPSALLDLPDDQYQIPTSGKQPTPQQTTQQQDPTNPTLKKLLHLLGPRYNNITHTAKLSCELHPTAPQNKRHLADLVSKLIVEAKDETDTFGDIPLDLRHMRRRQEKLRRRNITFPEGWKMSDERRGVLEGVWKAQDQRAGIGGWVDGEARVQRALYPPKQSQQRQGEEVMVESRVRAPSAREVQRTTLR